jgi:hypothetical protein
MFQTKHSQLSLVRKLRPAALLVAAATFSSVARADAISQSLIFRLNPAAPTEVLHFQDFDPSLGTLESVSISFDATRRHDWALWNTSDQAASVDYVGSLTGTTLQLDGNGYSFSDLSIGPGNTGTLSPVALPALFGELQNGLDQFLGGNDPVYPSAFHPVRTLTNLTGLYSPVSYTGDLNLFYAPGSFSLTADNILAASLVDVAGIATVTYNYRTVSVPDDSPPGISVAVLWFGLAAVARVRRSGFPATP